MNTFIFFLLDTPTGKAYYRTKDGTIQKLVITANSDLSLPEAPMNWQDIELSFIRNTSYHGINRSFSTPIQFVRTSLTMIKELFLLGVGTEVPLSIAIFKYNSQPLAGEPTYKLYYKGNLDLPKISEQVLESLQVNVMEGGVLQLLKSYENTPVQIPCDGSIPENQKINFDGVLIPDTFYYKISAINDPFEVAFAKTAITPLPCVFINDEGENYGIIHQDPTLIPTQYSGAYDPNQIINASKIYQDYLFQSIVAIQVAIKGTVIIRYNNPSNVQFILCTNAGQYIPITELIYGEGHYVRVFTFSQIVNLAAYESLFLWIQFDNFGIFLHNMIDILDGNFSLSFISAALPTRAWGVTAFDLFKLIVQQICLLASTTDQHLDYQVTSQLLQNNLNLFILSGDALRASGDSTWQRYFSITEQNQILQTSFGPSIKITLKDFFDSMNVILKCALSNGHNGIQETLFLETLESVYDSSSDTFDLGEVASLKWNFAEDLAFSDLEIGYPEQTYDQQAGKYEYNTTLVMKAPVKSFQKKLSIISKIRWDSYGMERLRSGIASSPTSTTRNDADTDNFGVNIDISKWVYDYFSALFTSINPNPDDSLNSNQLLQQNVSSQQLTTVQEDGEYFQVNLDNSIIVFSIPGFANTEAVNLTIDGIINSVNKPPLAGPDTITISLVWNGTVIYTTTITVSGVNTPITINHDMSLFINYKDCFYVTMSTSTTGVANINSASLSFGTYLVASGSNIPVDSGTPQKLLSWATFSPSSKPYNNFSVAQYGFQYFVFNSIVPNTNFALMVAIAGYIWNQTGVNFQLDIYINGQLQTPNNIVVPSTHGPITPIAPSIFAAQLAGAISRNYQLNDIVFITGSVNGTDLNVELNYINLLWTSNYIKAYSLKRVQYDFLAGIPNLAVDKRIGSPTFGQIRTDVAGAPYNIEQLTPKTCYLTWQNYFLSTFMDQVKGQMKFQTLSKNQYLNRGFNKQVITEDANENIDGFERMFYPIEIEIKTNVPIGFAELLSSATNAHIHFTFMGNDLYFFPDSLVQKPALNESQTWKGILSPKTNLSIFTNINTFRLPDMADNSISCAFASPVQFVPLIQSLPEKYHTRNRNTFLFKDQIQNWSNTHNYSQPVQIGDPIPLQFITRGLDPVYYTIYNKKGIYNGLRLINLTTIASPAVQDPYILWQTIIDTTDWPEDCYFIVITAGVGTIAAEMVSEILDVKPAFKLNNTILFEYSSSFNSQGLVFDGTIPYVGSMRVYGGYDNLFQQKYLGKFYIDQPQDIKVLNAIPYEITNLFIGFNEGVPDYVPKKCLRILLMDGCLIDGEGFSLNDGAELEQTFTQGAPLKYYKVEIRPSLNPTGINVVAAGIDTDASLIASVNQQSFGPNLSNESGETETDLINIIVT